MLQLNFRTKKIGPVVVGETETVTVINEEKFELEDIPAGEAKGRRYYDIAVPDGWSNFVGNVPMKDWREHDPDWIKAGYLRAMNIKVCENAGKDAGEDAGKDAGEGATEGLKANYVVRVPKANDELRELWEWTGKKASFELSCDWDGDGKFAELKKWGWEVGEEKGVEGLDFSKKVTLDQMNAYMCGYMTACACYRNKKNGYISMPFEGTVCHWKKSETANYRLDNHHWDYCLSETLCESYEYWVDADGEKVKNGELDASSAPGQTYKVLCSFNPECNSELYFVQDRECLDYIMKNIGVVGKVKRDKLRGMLLMRCFNISSVKSVKDMQKKKEREEKKLAEKYQKEAEKYQKEAEKYQKEQTKILSENEIIKAGGKLKRR